MNDYFKEKLEQIMKDEYQKQAYLSTKNTVVIAGPGSGKTTVLTTKMADIVYNKITSNRGVACITFSNDVAKMLVEKLEKYEIKKKKSIFIGTIHSFCINEVIKPFMHLYDEYSIPIPIRIATKKMQKSIIDFLKKKYNLNYLSMQQLDIERLNSIVKNSKIERRNTILYSELAKEYVDILYKNGYTDYNEIIIIATKMILEKSEILKCLEAKFPYFFVDEYQDLGRPLHEIILEILHNSNIKIFAVGDMNQSIYSFLGANPIFFKELSVQENINRVELKNNYRSNQEVIESFEKLLDTKKSYISKNDSSEKSEILRVNCNNGIEEQFDCIAKRIIPYYTIKKNVRKEEIAILVSKNNQAKDLKKILERENIPCYISKKDFERTEVVKWLEDCALWSIDNSKIQYNKIYEFWKKLYFQNKVINDDKDKIEKEKLYRYLVSNMEYKDDISKWIDNFIYKVELIDILSENSENKEEIENLKLFCEVAKEEEYKDKSIEYLANLGKPLNQIVISTRHSSKGLEFEVIIMPEMEQGHFPSGKIQNYDEEKRICFVCVSRAKKHCVFLYSRWYIENGIQKEYKESKFLKMIFNDKN